MKPAAANAPPGARGCVDVNTQLVRLLYRNSPTGLAVNVAIALLLCWVLMERVAHEVLGLWLVAVLLAILFRLYNYLRFMQQCPADHAMGPWRSSLLTGTTLSALVWGLTPWLFGPFDSLQTPMILAFSLGGLMAGATAVLGGVLYIYLTYAVVIMGPVTVWFILQPQRPDLALGVMLVVAVVALAANSVVYRRVLRESIELSNALYRAKQEAELAGRAKMDFLSRMSHELRTPLSTILGFAQLVQEQHARGSQHWVYLDQIVDASDHLLALIDDLLDLSRIESRNVALTLEPVSCAALIEQCLRQNASLADEYRVMLYHLPGSENLAVTADGTRLRQVFLNLLTNACANNRPGGRLGVGAEAVGEHAVRLYVDDLSHSVPVQWHDQMFMSYHALGRDQSAVEGTGLGLMISQHLVELMGGRVEAARTGTQSESTVPRFSLLLPRAACQAVPREQPLSYPADPAPQRASA